MKRASSPSVVRLDIVGLEPRLFQICKESNRAVVQSRGKERIVSTETAGNLEPSSNPELSSVPKDQITLYNKIVSITVDFERAYGRTVEVRVFEKSSNKLFNTLLRRRQSSEEVKPVFYVNGVKVFTGVPNSFSELDEAIDNSFGRKNNERRI